MTLREQYNRDGYYVVKDALPTKDNSWMYEGLQKVYDISIEQYIERLTITAKLHATYAVLMSDEVLGWLFIKEPSIASAPSMHVMCNSLKIPGGYNGTVAHQDWASTQGSIDSQTVWVPLTPTKGNFPLEVIPGSHKRGLVQGITNGSVTEVAASDDEFVTVDCEVGDVVYMSSFLIHRTGQGGDGFRMAMSIRYDNPMEPTFINRGFYSAQKKMVDRSVAWTPSPEQLKAVFSVE